MSARNTSARNTSAPMANKPSMFSLISTNGIAGATTIRDATQGHRILTNRTCNNCTCSPGLLSRNGRRSTIYLKRMMSSSNIHGHSSSRHRSNSASNSLATPPSSPRKTLSSNLNIEEVCQPEINTSLRLESLRNLMKEQDLSIYIVPSEDAHQSEYTSLVDKRLEFISGFTGSYGIGIITRDLTCMNDKPQGLAMLGTDGRYFTQATNELDFNWNLLKLGLKNELTWEEWTIKHACLSSVDSGEVINIGIDPKLISYNKFKNFQQLLEKKLIENKGYKIKILPIRDNLIDKFWGDFEIQPLRAFKPILKLDDKLTGESTIDKLKKLNNLYFKKYNSRFLILNSLDEIAWLLNLRGEDIEYNPLFYSYLIVEGEDNLSLYTNNHERFDDLKDYLKEINCELKSYDEIWFDIRKIATSLNNSSGNLLITEDASWKMINCIIAKNFIEIESPIKIMKEVKNDIELNGQIKAQIDEGFALINFFSWLEKKLVIEGDFVTELEASDKLFEFKSSLPNFKGLSFETISSSGKNSAVVHYTPKTGNSLIINPNKIYLCDTGSQFLNGTTDTTRTFHFTKPTNEEVDNYTLVLKGQIELSNLIIPENKVTGYQIDCIARKYLWTRNLDYLHGTGHGVDCYGPVHSSGIGIGFKSYCNNNVLKNGNLLTIEPGYYKAGDYGIRIENMVYLKKIDNNEGDKDNAEDNESNDNEDKEDIDGFLKFVTTTKVPYCRKLINLEMLSKEEKDWINNYHNEIWKLYEHKFEKKSLTWNWLKRETSPL